MFCDCAASLATISTPVGCLIAGPLLERVGRRASLVLTSLPCLVGWVLVAAAPSDDAFLPHMYAGRVLAGLALGLVSAPSTVYLAEISQNSLRGMLTTWTSVSIALGVFLVYVLGYAFQENWRLVATLSAIPAVLSGASCLFLTESPAWLFGKGRFEAGERSLRRLRGLKTGYPLPDAVLGEKDALISASARQESRRRRSNWFRNTVDAFRKPEALKPLIIMNVFFFFQQFSGIFVIIFYAVDVVKESGAAVDDYLAAVLIGATRLLVTLAVSYVSSRFGRRLPSLVSGAGMTLCMVALGTHVALDGSLAWLPVTAILLYIVASTLGFHTMPWAMMGEVFPAEVRGVASGVTSAVAYIFCFISLKIYPDLIDALGKHGLFFFYGAVSLLGTVFVAAFVPETKNKSLEEIRQQFTKEKRLGDVVQNGGAREFELRSLTEKVEIKVVPKQNLGNGDI